ncbi:MAG: hypothetical protein IPP66_09095 [Anaerolineales bacterium]|nr:hypothetical protein [Anaerolineales bacterium]
MSKDNNPVSVFRVVIASPNDVERERAIVRKVIENLNKNLASIDENYRLDVVEQKDAAPGAGNPEDRVSEQLAIPNCHIFIGIFWRRFGNPPKIIRPKDSSYYLSGTESEIDMAFNARKNNSDIKPEIMLYRKVDIPDEADKFVNDKEAIVQYARVIEYFEKIEIGEKHPLFYAEFSDDDFSEKLHRDLLKVCTENKLDWRNFDSGTYYVYGGKREVDPEEAWLLRSPFKFNPLSDDLKERVRLENYTVLPCSRSDLRRLITGDHLVYVFGDKGAGKTTLLENILRIVSGELDEEILRKEKIYCLRIGPEHFESQLERIGRIEDYQTHDFIRLVFNMVTDGVIKFAQRDIPKPDVDFRRPSETLAILLRWLQQERYTSLICLVDGLDEINAVKVSSNPGNEISSLLRNIVSTPKVEGMRLRLFLTSNLERIMRQERNLFQLDHYPPVHIEWNDSKLIQLLNQRFQVASKTGANIAIGELCPDVTEIERELVHRANNNPRAMLWLARRLFEIHFQGENVQDNIGMDSWMRLIEEWKTKKLDFTDMDNHKGFWIDEKEIRTLKKQSLNSRKYCPIFSVS